MKRIAFYTRISTDEDKQKYSLDAQRDRREALRPGAVRREVDTVSRSTATRRAVRRAARRPGEMLADAKADSSTRSSSTASTAYSRKLRELAPMIEGLTKWGVSLKSSASRSTRSRLADSS